ncbi:MAG: YrdB family protein [Halanaeroarchaeum sp.]
MADSPLEPANRALRFVLEVVALGALAYWGYGAATGIVRWVLAVGAPLVAMVLWGIFGSPRAPRRLAGWPRVALETVIFGAGVLALYRSTTLLLAVGFALVVLGNRLLLWQWDSER